MFLALVPTLVNTLINLLDNSTDEKAKGLSSVLSSSPKLNLLTEDNPEGIENAPKIVSVPLGVLEIALDVLSGDVSEAAQDAVRTINLALKGSK